MSLFDKDILTHPREELLEKSMKIVKDVVSRQRQTPYNYISCERLKYLIERELIEQRLICDGEVLKCVNKRISKVDVEFGGYKENNTYYKIDLYTVDLAHLGSEQERMFFRGVNVACFPLLISFYININGIVDVSV